MYGWMGAVLRVDLTSGKIEREPLSDYLRLNYMGGRGINSRIVWEEIKPHTDGLAPENVLVFGSGLLNGTLVPSGGRFEINAMSPYTNILGRSNSGGFFAPEMKYAGYDHIVFTGKADRPIYLWIDNDNVEFRDARHLWGKKVSETNDIIRRELGDPRVQIACIGPAGENLVRYASVMISKDAACGHTGMGAVMGSKNLKAVAVRGTKGVKVARLEYFTDLAKKLHRQVMENPRYPTFSIYGTTELLDRKLGEVGLVGKKNLSESGYMDEYECHSAENWARQFRVKQKACFGCPIHCRCWSQIREGPFAGEKGVMPEYAAQSSFGPLCGNTYAPAIVHIANAIGNECSIDYYELGDTLAIAMDWYEHGLITKQDTDGVELTWGNWPAMVDMCEKVVRREGFGDVLAEGAVRAAEKIGKGAIDYLCYSKGALYNGDDTVRANIGYKLGVATSSRGADHLSGAVAYRPGYGSLVSESMWEGPKLNPKIDAYEDQAAPVYYVQTVCTLADSLGVCKFATARVGQVIGLDNMAELYTAATGVEADRESITKIADRIWSVERAFIVREGITRKDDNVYGKAMNEPIPSGPYKGFGHDPEKWDKLLDEYYELNGWDKKTGVPTRARLEDLGLEDIANELEELGKLRKIETRK